MASFESKRCDTARTNNRAIEARHQIVENKLKNEDHRVGDNDDNASVCSSVSISSSRSSRSNRSIQSRKSSPGSVISTSTYSSYISRASKTTSAVSFSELEAKKQLIEDELQRVQHELEVRKKQNSVGAARPFANFPPSARREDANLSRQNNYR